jgi:hypothetical protein
MVGREAVWEFATEDGFRYWRNIGRELDREVGKEDSRRLVRRLVQKLVTEAGWRL